MDDLSGAFNDGHKLKPLIPWRLIILALGLLAWGIASAQSYTIVQVVNPPPNQGVLSPSIQGSPQVVGIGDTGSPTTATAYNGTYYVGGGEDAGISFALIWLNGINQPATRLDDLYAPPSVGLSVAESIDANGNIMAATIGPRPGNGVSPITSYLLIPIVNPMQAQVTATENQLSQALDQVASLQSQLATAQANYLTYYNSVVYNYAPKLAQSRASGAILMADYQASQRLANTLDLALAAADQTIAKCRANKGVC